VRWRKGERERERGRYNGREKESKRERAKGQRERAGEKVIEREEGKEASEYSSSFQLC